MTAEQKNQSIAERIHRRTGKLIDRSDAGTLRRAEMTLHRWAELECGDGNDYASWAIERDEQTQAPYLATYPHTGDQRRHKIADKERGALARLTKLCQRLGLHYFHQTDPRGCALYVSDKPLDNQNYTNGIAVSV